MPSIAPSPHEYAARVIVPNLKALVAIRLAGMGYKQYTIAKLLGVSQPMVHKYLSKPEEYYIAKLSEEGVEAVTIREAVEAAVKAVLEGRVGDFWLVVNELVVHTRGCDDTCRRILCRAPQLLPLSYYESVLARLASIDCLDKLLPEVGGNLAYAPGEQGSPDAIIALDGRIVKSRSGAVIAGTPTRGGSRHTAGILSRYSKWIPSLRWALALSPTSQLLSTLRGLGVEVVPLGSKPKSKRGPIAVIEEPEKGREAVIYILSDNPESILEIVEASARAACREDE